LLHCPNRVQLVDKTSFQAVISVGRPPIEIGNQVR
jgi:hypothetical protein